MAIQVESIGDGVALATVGATLVGWLPPAAAFLSIVWISLQIFINWDKVINRIKEIKDKRTS